MTRPLNARLAGFAFLAYIAVGIGALVVGNGATAGSGMAAKLANIAQHTADLRLVALLSLASCFAALLLGVTLHSLTHTVDADLALLGLVCRVIEAVPSIAGTLGLVWLASSVEAKAFDPALAQAFGAFLLRPGDSSGTIFFAVASTLFAALFWRGRLVPRAVAGLGIVASVLLAVVLPLQLAGWLGGPSSWAASLTWLIWLPMLVYEVALAGWLIVKGVTPSPMPSR